MEITIRAMSKKELRTLCDCSHYQLTQGLEKCADANKTFGHWKGRHKLSKAQVKFFLIHTDMLPEKITL